MNLKVRRRGGRGLRIPSVWEKWPDDHSLDDDIELTYQDEERGYEVDGLLAETDELSYQDLYEELPENVDMNPVETEDIIIEPEIEINVGNEEQGLLDELETGMGMVSLKPHITPIVSPPRLQNPEGTVNGQGLAPDPLQPENPADPLGKL